jgi:ribosomal protein S18 acetylase RimI-like enzyme
VIETLRDSPETLAGLSELLIEATADGFSVGFLHPLDRARADRFWQESLAEAALGHRVILGERDGARLVGTVTLVLIQKENQPHRAEIQKLLVAGSHRRRGVGRRLMAEAESLAGRAGRTLLVLDTATAEAAKLYESTGWSRTGEIPDFALLPDGKPCATAVYWKRV